MAALLLLALPLPAFAGYPAAVLLAARLWGGRSRAASWTCRWQW